jgi:hypothetical protein
MLSKVLKEPIVTPKQYKKPISLAEKDVIREEGIYSIMPDGTKRVFRYKHRRQYKTMSMRQMLKEVAYEEGMKLLEEYTEKLHAFYEVRAKQYNLFKQYESVIAEAGLDVKYFDDLFWGKKPYNDNKSRDFRYIYGYTKGYSINGDEELAKRIGGCLFFACKVYNNIIRFKSKIKIAHSIIRLALRKSILYRYTDICNINLAKEILYMPGHLIYPSPGLGHFYLRLVELKEKGINWQASIQKYRKLVEEGAKALNKEDYVQYLTESEIPVIKWVNKRCTYTNKDLYKFVGNTGRSKEAYDLSKAYFRGETVDKEYLYKVISKKNVGLYAKILLACRLDPQFKIKLGNLMRDRDTRRLDSYIQYMRDRKARREAEQNNTN